jgi:crotonobetainyl-CoA:carnitine CoA-transferase CaiB-like acyl-CoA transferase
MTGKQLEGCGTMEYTQDERSGAAKECMTMAGPLDGVRVIDVTAVIAGPFATMVLGDLGATVIKIEPLRGDDSRHLGPPFQQGTGHLFLGLNRNKYSLALDLKQPAALEIVTKLVEGADVFLESARPGAMERLGLGYDVLRLRNPRLIYCSNSPYGPVGPHRDKAGYELVIQGYAALLHRGEAPPQRERQSIVDVSTGMTIASSILAALYARERTGQGQRIDTSLLASIMSVQAGRFVAGPEKARASFERTTGAATYRPYKTQDIWITVAVLNDNLFRKLCQALDRPELLEDARFQSHASRVEHEGTLAEIIGEILLQRPGAEWLVRLDAEGVPCGPIQPLEALFDDPQLRANDLVAEIHHPQIGSLKTYGIGPKFSATPAGIRMPPPTLGQHTDVLLSELGYSPEEIAVLRQQSIVA